MPYRERAYAKAGEAGSNERTDLAAASGRKRGILNLGGDNMGGRGESRPSKDKMIKIMMMRKTTAFL